MERPETESPEVRFDFQYAIVCANMCDGFVWKSRVNLEGKSWPLVQTQIHGCFDQPEGCVRCFQDCLTILDRSGNVKLFIDQWRLAGRNKLAITVKLESNLFSSY